MNLSARLFGFAALTCIFAISEGALGCSRALLAQARRGERADIQFYLNGGDEVSLLRDLEEKELGKSIRVAKQKLDQLTECSEPEAKSVREAREHWLALRNKMAMANRRLVFSIARAFRGRGLPMVDLLQEGSIRLLDGIDNYDPAEYKTRFSTFAVHRIKKAIRVAIADTAPLIRIPQHALAILSRYRKMMRKMMHESGEVPSFDEVADEMGLCGKRREPLRCALKCLNVQLGHRGFDEFGDPTSIFDDYLIEESDAAEHQDLIERLKVSIASVDENTQKDLDLLWGVGDERFRREKGLSLSGPISASELGIARATYRKRREKSLQAVIRTDPKTYILER